MASTVDATSPQAAQRLPAGVLAGRGRIVSVDLLRGLVMVLMALDHARYYFSVARVSPEVMEGTTLPLFATRWVTHLCAPAFFLLAGTSIYLARERRSALIAPRTLTALRGLWLIVIELTVVGFAWSFAPGHSVAGVIWCLGWAMLFVAALSVIRPWTVAVIAIAIIAGHDLLNGLAPERFGAAAWLWQLSHVPWQVELPSGIQWFVLFPLIPWIAVAALGYALGPLFNDDPARRRSLLLRAGLSMITTFVVLRVTNVYGNPSSPSIPGAAGDFLLPDGAGWQYALIALLNVEKYPPSLQFLLMTLGVLALLLAWYQRYDAGASLPAPQRWIHVFGLVPLFFYVLHLFVLHTMAWVVAVLRGQPSQWLAWGGTFPAATPEGYGYGLPGVYVATVGALLILYPACRAFARFKMQHRSPWLSFT